MTDTLTVTVKQLAQLMGIHPNSIYRGIAADEFPIAPIKVGKKFLFSKTEVWRLLGDAPTPSIHHGV